jgi:hypothetical protein
LRAGKQEAPAPQAPQPLPYEVNQWLEKFGAVLRGDDYPAELNQRLLYCFAPSQDVGQIPVLAVWLRSVRVLKGGDFATNYAQPTCRTLLRNGRRNTTATPISRF